MASDISILFYDKRLVVPFVNEFSESTFTDEIMALKRKGYKTTVTADPYAVSPAYDIIVAHPHEGHISRLVHFQQRFPLKPVVIHSGYIPVKLGDGEFGFVKDATGTYVSTMGIDTIRFVAFIDSLVKDLPRSN